jgi:PleD family two-component response regulator
MHELGVMLQAQAHCLQPEAILLAERDENPIHKLRVLVVEDNKDAGYILNLLLQSMGQEVRAAHDGPSAIAIALTSAIAVPCLQQ